MPWQIDIQSLENVEVMHLHTEGRAAYTEDPYHKSFRINSAFVGGNVRKAIQEGRGDYIPIFLERSPLAIQKTIFCHWMLHSISNFNSRSTWFTAL